MSGFKAYTAEMTSCAQRIQHVAVSVKQCAQEVKSISNQMVLHGASGEQIRRTLGNLSSMLEKDRQTVYNLQGTLDKIVRVYQQGDHNAYEAYETGSQKEKKTGTGETAGGAGKDSANSNAELLQKVACFSGAANASGEILGIDAAGEVIGDFLGASWKRKLESGVKWKEETDAQGNKIRKLDNVSLITAAVAGEVHAAKGSAKGHIGLLRGEISGSVGEIGGKGQLSAALYRDGKLSPQIDAGAEVSVVGMQAKGETGVGTENNNLHVGAEGKVGVANANAEIGAGKVFYTNKKGNTVEGYGFKAEAGAEAYAAEGRISGGFTLFGVDIDVGITGKTGGGGAKIGGAVTTGGVGGSVGVGIGVGVGLDFSIDWSNFKFGW